MRPLKILIIDDDPMIGMTLNAFLSGAGHQALHLTDAEQALQRYTEESFDMVLIDQVMPQLDGLEATRRLRNLQQHSGWRPIIMLSGASQVEEQVQALASGCDDFLAKPINFRMLSAKISAFSRIAQMQEQIAEQHAELLEYANREAEEMRISSFLMERLIRREHLDSPLIQYQLQPAGTVSGDMLMVNSSRSGTIYVMLADALGHGLPAALTLIPLSQTFYAMSSKGFQLNSIVRELNRQHQVYSPPDRFVAALIASFNPREGSLQVWNGGIPPALLLSDSGQLLARFKSNDLPLGIAEQNGFQPALETYMLEAPAQLFMYSDGLVEAENPNGQAFGRQRLEQVLCESTAPQRLARLLNAVRDHLQSAKPHDDLSCLALSCQETREAPGLTQDKPQNQAPSQSWSLQLDIGVAQFRRLDVEPIVSSFCQTLGLDENRYALFSLILRELLSNSLEHGLLGMQSGLKNEEDGFERYLQLREERLAQLYEGEIRIEASQFLEGEEAVLRVQVTDSGPGFDYQHLVLDREIDDQEHYHGRGLRLVKRMCSRLEFFGRGNQALAELRWTSPVLASTAAEHNSNHGGETSA